jgi:methionyl-tRNA formyltransferase
MVEALAALEAGTLRLTPQPADGATYARKIFKEETRIDWRLPAADVHNRIRGLSPFPGAWCEMPAAGGAERVKLLRSTLAQGGGVPGAILDDRLAIACGEGAVRLVELQRAGGRPVDAAAFVRGLQTLPERLL